MGVASGCGCKEVAIYIDFIKLLIPTPLVSVLFCSSIPTFCSFLKMFFVLTYSAIYVRTARSKKIVIWHSFFFFFYILLFLSSTDIASAIVSYLLTLVYI